MCGAVGAGAAAQEPSDQRVVGRRLEPAIAWRLAIAASPRAASAGARPSVIGDRPRNRAIVEALYGTGARVAELVELERKQLVPDTEDGPAT